MKKELKLILHDNLKRKFFKKYWLKRRLLNFLLKSTSLIFLIKQYVAAKSSNIFFKKGNISIFKNRCVLSGRSYSIDSKFRTSRFALRLLLNDGLINNIRRSSW